MLADLDARGLIERRPDREDQRLHRLHLSPTGTPPLAGWRAQVLAEEDRRFGMLSAEERATLRRLLVRVWAPD